MSSTSSSLGASTIGLLWWCRRPSATTAVAAASAPSGAAAVAIGSPLGIAVAIGGLGRGGVQGPRWPWKAMRPPQWPQPQPEARCEGESRQEQEEGRCCDRIVDYECRGFSIQRPQAQTTDT